MSRFERHDYHQPWDLFEDVRVEYFNAGHILGAALTTFEFRDNGRTLRLGMSGDLGRPARPILQRPRAPSRRRRARAGEHLRRPPAPARPRVREPAGRHHRAHRRARRARLLVPAFAVGRTQELVATLHGLCARGRACDLPIFVDSPMAREATGVFVRHPECFDEETREAFTQAERGAVRLRAAALRRESRRIAGSQRPAGAVHHHRRFRDVRRRAESCTTCSHGLPDAKQHRAVRGLPGRGHAGTADCATVSRPGEHLWRAGAR